MGNEQRHATWRHRRHAVTKFRRDIDLDRHAGDLLDPVFADQPGIIGGAAGDDGDSRHRREIDRQWSELDIAGGLVGERAKRIADHRRLLVDFLQHIMAIFALAGQDARYRALQDRPIDDDPIDVIDRRVIDGDHRPIAVMQIGDAAGQAGQRHRVRRDEHLSIAIADRERRSLPRGDQHRVRSAKQHQQGESALKPLQRRGRRVYRRQALIKQVRHQMGDHLRIGLAFETALLGHQFGLQLLIILDDAVMDDRDLLGRMRVGVLFGRPAMCGPARMTDADRPVERLQRQALVQVA